MSHHEDRFGAAMSVLAGHGHIKQRLIEAFELLMQDVDDDFLPSPVRKPFAELRHTVTQVAPLNGEGPICASVRKMSIDEADECAHRLLELYGDVIRLTDDAEDTDAVGDPLPLTDATDDVPAMLLKSV